MNLPVGYIFIKSFFFNVRYLQLTLAIDGIMSGHTGLPVEKLHDLKLAFLYKVNSPPVPSVAYVVCVVHASPSRTPSMFVLVQEHSTISILSGFAGSSTTQTPVGLITDQWLSVLSSLFSQV